MRLVHVTTVTAVLACTVALGSGGAAPMSPFAGDWMASDVDGSNMTMRVSGSGAGGVHSIKWLDDGVSVCDPAAPPSAPTVPGVLKARTTIDASGPVLTMTGVVRIACSDGSAPELNNVEVTWEQRALHAHRQRRVT